MGKSNFLLAFFSLPQQFSNAFFECVCQKSYTSAKQDKSYTTIGQDIR